ncbi:cell division protein FtsX, partial [Neisseria meningitidis]
RSLLARDKRIANVRFICKEDGLAELQSNLDQNLVSMLDGNPLPDAFIVTPDPATTPAQMQAIYRDITKLPMVESASMDTEWVQTLYQINEFIRKILWFLSLTLGMAFVLVAHNTIRLQILSRKEEIEITKLLGAPASFIRRPFLYQAMWQSILSAAVSLGLCGWLLSTVRPLVDAIFKPYGLNIGWRFFYPEEIALVFGFVIALGVFGAWLATTQHLLGFKAKK